MVEKQNFKLVGGENQIFSLKLFWVTFALMTFSKVLIEMDVCHAFNSHSSLKKFSEAFSFFVL